MSEPCPVSPYDRAGVGYSSRVAQWLSDPNAHFKAFGPEARAFQKRHRSERLRTMTLVAPAEKFVGFKPVLVGLDGVCEKVRSWEQVFAIVSARLIAAHEQVFAALQEADELDWLGSPKGSVPVAEALAAGTLKPGFSCLAEVVFRVQWLFLMCGIRLNEVLVQVDPYTDDEWKARHAQILEKRSSRKMTPNSYGPCPPISPHFTR